MHFVLWDATRCNMVMDRKLTLFQPAMPSHRKSSYCASPWGPIIAVSANAWLKRLQSGRLPQTALTLCRAPRCLSSPQLKSECWKDHTHTNATVSGMSLHLVIIVALASSFFSFFRWQCVLGCSAYMLTAWQPAWQPVWQHGRICGYEVRGPYLWQLHKVKGSDVTFNPRPDSKLENAPINSPLNSPCTWFVYICFMLLDFRLLKYQHFGATYIKKPSQTCAGAV